MSALTVTNEDFPGGIMSKQMRGGGDMKLYSFASRCTLKFRVTKDSISYSIPCQGLRCQKLNKLWRHFWAAGDSGPMGRVERGKAMWTPKHIDFSEVSFAKVLFSEKFYEIFYWYVLIATFGLSKTSLCFLWQLKVTPIFPRILFSRNSNLEFSKKSVR